MITSLTWLLIGCTLWAGHTVALAGSWLGGWDEAAILATLIAVSSGAGVWAVWYGDRRDQQQAQARRDRGGPPDDGDPLTAYELAVLGAIERGELYEGIYDDQGDC